jgi:hypothetical protein
VFLLWFPPISSCYQTSRQTQRGRGFGGEVRGPPLWHTGESNTSSISSCVPHGNFKCLLAIVSLYKSWTGGPVRDHPRSYVFAMDLWIGTPHLLHSQATSYSHMFTCRHLFPLHSQCLGVMVLFCSNIFGWLQEMIKFPFCHLGAGLMFEPRFLLVWWVALPSLVPALPWFHCASEALAPTCQEDESFLWSNPLLAPGRITFPGGLRDAFWWQGRWKNTASESQTNLQKCRMILKDREMGYQGSLIGNVLLCWHRLSGLLSKGWALRTKGPHLIYPCKQVTEARSKV